MEYISVLNIVEIPTQKGEHPRKCT